MDKWLQKVRKRLLTNFSLETDSPTRLNFVNQLLRPQMTVLEEHPRVSVTRDHRHLSKVQPKLKQVGEGFMMQVAVGK